MAASPGLPPWVNEHMRTKLYVSPKNPLDICTIISIYPKGFTEKKAMMPEWYHVPSGTYEQPGFLVVGGASSWREMMDTKQVIEIPISSVSVAESVIRDWMIGILEVHMGQSQPGVFFLPGEWDNNKLRSNLDAMNVLNRARELQNSWFLALINMADALWARSGGNPLAISDLMRIAAQIMQMDKPWMKNFQAVRMIPCPACSHMVMPGFPVCANCKIVVDPVAFAKLGLMFATPPSPGVKKE
jgi:hypothetical protein